MKQTFIIRLETADGLLVTFERWAYKRLQTCIDKMVKLYKEYGCLYQPSLEKASYVVAYATPDGYHTDKMVWKVTVDEFKTMMEGA